MSDDQPIFSSPLPTRLKHRRSRAQRVDDDESDEHSGSDTRNVEEDLPLRVRQAQAVSTANLDSQLGKSQVEEHGGASFAGSAIVVEARESPDPLDCIDSTEDVFGFPSSHDRLEVGQPESELPSGWSDAEDERHYQLGGIVLVPVRDASFPEGLRQAEEQMAGQIARALHHPSNEGLHSATFDTLIRECLLPRLAGKDIRGNPFAIGHYSQLAILKLSETAPLSKAHQVRLQAIDPDVDTARRIKAFQERRLPDFSSLIFFKEKKIVAKGRLCRVKTYLGPQFSITEVKSLEETAVNDLDRVLPVVLWGAHKQNQEAAQFMFAEDHSLDTIAGFVGSGPGWSYAEYYRTWFVDPHGKPWPRKPAQVKSYEDRDILEQWRKGDRPPVKKRKGDRPPVKKRKRYIDLSSSEYDDADYVPDAFPSSDSVDNAPTADGGVNDHKYPPYLGKDHPLPADCVKPIFGKKSFLYILDEEGRTKQAFDVIVKQIRSWYADREDGYRLTFDPDPYAA